MEVLEKVLEKNGIQVPKVPNAKSKSWFLWTLYKIRMRVFCWNWKEVITQYSYLEQAILRYYVEWYKCESEFYKNWREELSEYLGKEDVELKFRTPSEGEREIRKAIIKTNKATNELPFAISGIERNLREKWLKDIVSTAPQDCKLIVMKNNSYMNENLDAHFEREVHNKKQCHIQIEDSLYVSIAFAPNKVPNAETLYICKEKATIKYVK